MRKWGTEFYRNMREGDIPPWEKGLAFEDQPVSTQEFWIEEAKKIKYGLTIDGVEISGWLYFHLNHWRMYVDRLVRGRVERVDSLPDLRDNEWIFQEAIQKAEREKKGVILIGSRRIAKSCLISSVIAHAAETKKGSENVVVGGNQADLDTIANYADYGLLKQHPFLLYTRTGTDWDKGVEFGVRNIDNTKDRFSSIIIRNVNKGRTSATQNVAGATATTMVFDEIGKYPMMSPFLSAKHAMSTQYGWRSPILLMGTSGEIEMVQDALEIFNNPAIYNMIEMEWDWIERGCKEPTWTRRSCGVFMPGQMSIDEHCGDKTETTLGSYLGKEDSKGLSAIKIKVTNWEVATENLRAYFNELEKKNKKVATTERMFLPLDVDDCFLSDKDNPFPVALGARHRADLVARGETGKAVDVYLKKDGGMGYEMSEKNVIDKFPFPGGIADAPVLIFEDPPSHPMFNYAYASGLDFYKTTESVGTSVGAFYVFKRMIDIKDEWANRIVASYSSRPSTMENHHRTCEALQEGYGCECLMEGIDIAYEGYLTRKNKEYKLLASGIDLARKNISSKSVSQNKFGLVASQVNKEYVFKLVVNYTWTKFGEEETVTSDGSVVKRDILGIEMIPDIYLLDEMIAYKKGLNVDRIVAFGHALALARYYDSLNLVPKSAAEMEREAQMRDRPVRRIGAFGSLRVSAFKR